MSKLPALKRNHRLTGSERERISSLLAREYAKGKSIRDLSTEAGYSIDRVRALLLEAGVEFRPRGGRKTSA